MPVLNSDKRLIYLCGDYKVTINCAAQADQYTMPSADGIFARLVVKRLFTKLDLPEAYTQLVLDEESQLLAVVNTPKGMFAVTGLSYGTSAFSQIFQCELDRCWAMQHTRLRTSITSLLVAKMKPSFSRNSTRCL